MGNRVSLVPGGLKTACQITLENTLQIKPAVPLNSKKAVTHMPLNSCLQHWQKTCKLSRETSTELSQIPALAKQQETWARYSVLGMRAPKPQMGMSHLAHCLRKESSNSNIMPLYTEQNKYPRAIKLSASIYPLCDWIAVLTIFSGLCAPNVSTLTE